MRNIRPTKQTLATLMQGHATAEVVCPIKGTVVRRLTVVGDQLEIDAITAAITLPLSATVYYEPWTMDRGSMLLEQPVGDISVKLCTEFDIIRFPDGSETEVRS